MTDEPPRAANLPPGYDEDDPYEGVDVESLPDWWRRNITEFRKHGMRPYRPSKLDDGRYLPDVLAEFEERYGVRLSLRTVNPQDGVSWKLFVCEKPVTEISRSRTSEGRSVYHMTADELEAAIVENASTQLGGE